MFRWLSIWLAASLAVLAQCGGGLPLPGTPPLPVSPSSPALRIAILTPTSGELATFGRTLRSGSVMALDDWNSRGGLLGHTLQAIDYDTPCNFEAAQRVTGQAVADGLHFMIGPSCSEAAIAASLTANESGALLIAPGATHPLVTVDREGQTRPMVFRASHGYARQGQAMAVLAYTHLTARRAALLTLSGDDYSTPLTEAFAADFENLGGRVVYRGVYPPSQVDFKPLLQAAVQAGAEVLYLPASVQVVNQVTAQWRELNLSTQVTLLGSDRWEAPELDRAAAEGSYFPVHFLLEDDRPATRAWAEAYKAKYAVSPTTLAALGYEATELLLTAIQQAGSTEIEAVASVLAGGEFEGLAGRFHFDAQHNPLKPVPVVQLQGGQLVLVKYVNPLP